MSLKKLELDEVTKLNLGGLEGETNFVSESGFYTLVLRSKKDIAKPFRLWVTREVLPQIRKTGGYIPIQDEEPNEVFLARAVQVANETIKHKDEIIANQKGRIESLEETEKDWKLLMDCKGTFSVNEIAPLSVLVNINFLLTCGKSVSCLKTEMVIMFHMKNQYTKGNLLPFLLLLLMELLICKLEFIQMVYLT